MALVSCLMVTLGTPARQPMLARAIEGYAAQSHADRELIVVLDAGESADAIAALLPSDARIVRAPAGLPLGALRNLSVAAAQGAIVCQWDDDDLHHPQRIEAQLAALGEADACALQEVMLLDAAAGVLRWSNWAATPAGAHPGTLMARRDRLPLYPEVLLGEDLAVLEAIAARGAVARLAGLAYLYVYVSHGANSWPAEHHAMLGERLAVSRALLARREAALRAGLAPFGLAGTCVEGANGAAFTL